MTLKVDSKYIDNIVLQNLVGNILGIRLREEGALEEGHPNCITQDEWDNAIIKIFGRDCILGARAMNYIVKSNAELKLKTEQGYTARMSNTMDIMLTGAIDMKRVEEINQLFNLNLKQVSDSSLCGGTGTVWFESYAQCDHCSVGFTKGVTDLIAAIKNGEFPSELFSLMVDCDNDSVETGAIVNTA